MRIACLLLAAWASAAGAAEPMPALPRLREQARIRQQWLAKRLIE